MFPKKELYIITHILIPKETYHILIQENLDKEDDIKRHQLKEKENYEWDLLLDDKILGSLGG